MKPLPEPEFKIVVGDTDAPLAELTPYRPGLPADIRPINLDPGVLAALGDVIRVAPGALALGVQASSTTYLLTFAPDVALQIQAGTASVMQALNGGVRAVAVDASGQIIGSGTLVAARGLSSAMTAVMCWQTLALVTAQHYLHDMQRQLETISSTLKDIQDLLVAREFAVLVSHERYLQRTMDAIQRGAARELDMAAISVQLEQMERECDQVQEVMRHLMERQMARFKDMPITAWFPWEVERNLGVIQTCVAEFDRSTNGLTASIRIKMMIALVRALLLQQILMSLARLKEVEADQKRGRKQNREFYKLAYAKHDQIWANADPLHSLDAVRQSYLNQSDKRHQALRRQQRQFQSDLRALTRQIQNNHQMPASVFLQISRDGGIQAFVASSHFTAGQQVPSELTV